MLRTMNITLYGKRSFTDVIKDLELGDYPRLSGLSQHVFIRGRQGRSERRRHVLVEGTHYTAGGRDRKGREPRSAGDL